jgi:hypothetical protein
MLVQILNVSLSLIYTLLGIVASIIAVYEFVMKKPKRKL